MKVNKPIAFIVLAFVIGATISQGSFAFADDSSTNPFRAIWQAIGDLQTKTDSLQSQIDELKAQQSSPSASQLPDQIVAAKVSETSLAIELSGGQSGQTLVSLVAKNTGPDSAVGVKLSTYYQMALFHVNHIDGGQCTDQARGIIECYLGTIESGNEARITVDATPVQLGQQAIITADVSSITQDPNPGNNHAETVFVTSQTPVAIMPPAQQQQQPTTVVPPVEQQPSAMNQTSSSSSSSSAPSGGQQQQQQPVQNQTSTQETQSGNSTEQQPTEQSGRQQAPPSSEQSSAGNEGTGNSTENGSSGNNNSPAGSGSGSESSTGSSDTGSSSSSSTSSSSSDSSSSQSSSSSSSGTGSASTASSSSGDSGSSSSGDAGSTGGSSTTTG